MIISVASGKGGTGKTTIATSLAASLDQQVQLLDCDVEAPNAHLFLNPHIEKTQSVNAPVPVIDLEKCTFCKACMDICRFSAIAVLKNDVMVFDNLCHSCGGCIAVCPENAVTQKERALGKIETGTSDNIDFIHGRLEIGQVMVPPVIRHVRSHTLPAAVTIIDAPPGTSCPVIAAMNKADFILLVTEPTPFGLHDLKLAVETVRQLDIPHGIVINRAGLGNDAVNDYAREKEIPVLMEIPFDQRIAQAYSQGRVIARDFPSIKKDFQALYHEITARIEKENKHR